ncbi:MAG: DUF3336 domain-containing protein [Xanthomonadales bacterium]|nr:DUF3336 domain-containing protein [Xanthomonadales bacterium]
MSHEHRQLTRALDGASTYAEWFEIAGALDRLEKLDEWRGEQESADYDYRLITSRARLLRKLTRTGDYDRLIFRLREELHGNLGNMANPALYQKARTGTKQHINQYLDAVTAALELLCESEVDALPPMRKRRFLKRTARSFGRSALLLSGGAALGVFHLGVVDELEKQGLLPRVITGSSVGAIIAGIVATHSDAEIANMLEPGRLDSEWRRVFGWYEVMTGKGVLDPKLLQRSIKRNIKDMTFLEAYQQTGRILNISVSPADAHQFPRLLNYLTSPNVLIRRAALASSSLPGLFPAVQLSARNFVGKSVPYMPQSRWIDGSVHGDIPKEKVNRLHNVNHYIVSQTNPHVVPFLGEEMEDTGIRAFLQDLIVKAPMLQVENTLALLQQHFNLPGLAPMIKKAHAVVTQSYSGDITIYPERHRVTFSRLFANATPEEAAELVMEGRRASWPQIERIRNTTQISRQFDTCLRRLDERHEFVKR